MDSHPQGRDGAEFPAHPSVSIAVLAGGRSSRMGRNKALLRVGGSGILERTVTVLRPLAAELFIVADDAEAYDGLGLPVHPDLVPGGGALGGILTALRRAAREHVLCVACDMPFLDPAVAALIVGAVRPGDDAVIPRPAGGAEPLLALYHAGLAPALERAVREGRLRILDALAAARVRFLEAGDLRRADPGLRSFVNVNTPAELEAARRAAPRGEP